MSDFAEYLTDEHRAGLDGDPHDRCYTDDDVTAYDWHRSRHHGEHTCPEDNWIACMERR